ncbi:N-acetyltransferase [uncultured Exiguobacterium sp.]|uniref:GNAT family N-acetyltransferase n=1 Tax=uncultured Exiguobacterium sp. TaxID=202669 RepID=UPI0025FAD3DD|nr:GNAT family N-acetyltransferase [uncultured Exiguobacterium sp.]
MFVREQLIVYNRQYVPKALYEQSGDLCYRAYNEAGDRIGGITDIYSWQHIHVQFFLVSESARQAGIGTRLLQTIEAYAKKVRCTKILLDTFDFQAPDFYRKHGYEVYGRLTDHPAVGQTQYFFVKRL